MRFAVLGPTEVWDGDRRVELGPTRRRLVLAALLVDVGRVVPTPVLLQRVWDGEPPDSATATLHSYISRLRSTLAGAVSSPAAAVTTSPRGYALDVAPSDVDHWKFGDLLSRARRRHGDGDPAAARDLLDTALALWRGPAYADYDVEFARLEEHRLHELKLSAHELGAELDLELGRHAAVCEPLATLVAAEPLRESLRAALMLALYRSGRQAEALQVFADGRAVLADLLGTDPDVRLQRLNTQILRQDPELDLRVPVTVTPPPTETHAVSNAFIGRTRELDLVSAAASFVALVGEAGIGKSRLAEEAGVRARAAGDVVAWGRCWQHEGAPAMWPWIQAVRDIAAQSTPDSVTAALDARTGVLASLVPEFGDRSAQAEAPASVEQAEVAVFDAVVAFLDTLSTDRRILVVIDDVQWADPTSSRMLEYAATHLHAAGVTVIVTVRSPTDEPGNPDLAVLAMLARHPHVVRVDVPPLTPADVRDLVVDRVDSEPDEATTLALHARTGGNPFYVGEIVRLVVTTGRDRAIAEGVPDSIRGVIRRRLEQLSETDQQVLRVASVTGRTFDIDLIAAVSGVGEDDVDEAIDRATAFGLLRSEPGTVDQHRFTHALLQETLLDETGPSRQRRIHRAVGEALDGRRLRSGAGTAERVAHHFAAAGSEADLVRAVANYLIATDDADARASYAEVERLLRAALALTGRMTGPDADSLDSSVRYRLTSFYMLFDGPYSAQARQALLDEASPAGAAASVRELLTALHTEWGSLHGRNDLAAAEVATGRLTAAAEERDDDLMRIGALMTRGYDLLQRGRLVEAIDAFARMEPLLPTVTIPPLLFTPHPAIGGPLWGGLATALTGDDAGADELIALSERRCMELNDPLARNFQDGGLLLRWVWAGDVERAAAAAERCAATMGTHQMGMMSLYMSLPSAWVLAHRDLEAGLAAAESAMATVDQPAGMVWRPFLSGVFADVLVLAGQYRRAVERVDAALAESRASGAVLYDAELHRIRATALQGSGAGPAVVSGEVDLARDVATVQGASLFLSRLETSFPS